MLLALSFALLSFLILLFNRLDVQAQTKSESSWLLGLLSRARLLVCSLVLVDWWALRWDVLLMMLRFLFAGLMNWLSRQIRWRQFLQTKVIAKLRVEFLVEIRHDLKRFSLLLLLILSISARLSKALRVKVSDVWRATFEASGSLSFGCLLACSYSTSGILLQHADKRHRLRMNGFEHRLKVLSSCGFEIVRQCLLVLVVQILDLIHLALEFARECFNLLFIFHDIQLLHVYRLVLRLCLLTKKPNAVLQFLGVTIPVLVLLDILQSREVKRWYSKFLDGMLLLRHAWHTELRLVCLVCIQLFSQVLNLPGIR